MDESPENNNELAEEARGTYDDSHPSVMNRIGDAVSNLFGGGQDKAEEGEGVNPSDLGNPGGVHEQNTSPGYQPGGWNESGGPPTEDPTDTGGPLSGTYGAERDVEAEDTGAGL